MNQIRATYFLKILALLLVHVLVHVLSYWCRQGKGGEGAPETNHHRQSLTAPTGEEKMMSRKISFSAQEIRQVEIVDKLDTGDRYANRPSDRYIAVDEPMMPTVGTRYLVYKTTYERDGLSRLHFSDDAHMVSEGFPGNQNHAICKFHGWRGTTDGREIYAYGVRVCTQVLRREYAKTVHYTIVFGADETVGK